MTPSEAPENGAQDREEARGPHGRQRFQQLGIPQAQKGRREDGEEDPRQHLRPPRHGGRPDATRTVRHAAVAPLLARATGEAGTVS